MRKKQNENRRPSDDKDNTGPLYTVRWGWLLGTFALMVALGVTVVTVYFIQTKDQTEFRIQTFRNFEKDNLWRQGIYQLRLYQEEKPNDMAVVRELAEAYDRNGVVVSDWNYAAEFYQTLLGKITSDTERMKILERILDNQRKANDAKAMLPTIQRIRETDPENPLAWKCLVILRAPMLETGVYQPASDEPEYFDLLVQKARIFNPEDVDLTSAYCRLLRNSLPNVMSCVSLEFRATPIETRTEEADALMADFVKANADSPAALLAEYEYRRKYRLLDLDADELDDTLLKVKELDPDNVELMLFTGMFYERKALRQKANLTIEEYQIQRQDAIDLFEQMTKTTPYYPEGYLQLAVIYGLDGERDKQIEILEQANKLMNSGNLDIIFPLTTAYLENNDMVNADKMIRLIRDWTDRHRLALTKDDMTTLRNLATLLEGQSLAIGGHPSEAIAKFKSVLEPSIPPLKDIRTVFASLMIYAQLLADTLNLDSAVGVYEATIRHLQTELFADDQSNFIRMEQAYTGLIGALLRLGQTDKVEYHFNLYVQYLRKTLEQQPKNQMVRMALAASLFQQTMNQLAENRDWSELNTMIGDLQENKAGVAPPWRVDFLEANVKWEQRGLSRAIADDALILLRTVENLYNDHLPFLVLLEDTFHNYGAQKDSERILKQIHDIPDGLPYWYLLKAWRAEQNGNLLEAKRLMDEAVTEIPESFKNIFQAVQETLGRSLDQNVKSYVRERQTLERLRETNANNPSIPTLFQQALMELDRGNADAVAPLEIKLRKLEGEDATLTLLLEGERFLLEAVDEKDPKIKMARDRQQMLVLKRPHWEYTYLLAADIGDKVANEQEVIAALVKAIDAGNRDPMRYRDLIQLYLKAGQMEKAQAVHDRGIRLHPNLMSMMHFRFDPPYQVVFTDFARAIRREDADAARKIAEKWLTLAEKNNVDPHQMAFFYSFIAQNFFNIDQKNTSEEFFLKAAENGGEAVVLLARFRAATGKVQEGMDMIYKEMIHSETPEFYFLPVLTITRDYEYEPAWIEPFDAFADNADTSEIDDPARLYKYIEYWVIREKNDLTLPLYRQLSKLLPDNTIVLNDMAYTIAFQQTDDAAEREANIQEGLNLIDRALNSAKNDPNLMDTKALILLRQGKPANAVTWFKDAVELSNQAIIYRLHLAVALLRNQEKERAEEEFNTFRAMLVPQKHLLPESNRNYLQELLDAFPEKN